MTDAASDPTPLVPDVRILIADDHEVVRIGLASLLDRQPGFSVVGEARSGEEAVRLARRTHPDVVVMDIRNAWHQRHQGPAPHHGREPARRGPRADDVR